uniref:Prophage minor tail protein Z homolog n=1 Tax=Hydrogenovibrio crunogenus (strain DSM 25203 / XCL-2) TaxID=317025 RepID=Q31HU3_HYDCU
MIDLKLDATSGDIGAHVSLLRDLSNHGLQKAINRASKKMARWLQTHIARQAVRLIGMKISSFKKYRIKLNMRDSSGINKVWIGTNPIAAHHLQNPRWKRQWAGARAGGQTFDGAFIADSKSGGSRNGMKVFRRLPGQYNSAGKEKLEKVSIAINDDVKEAIYRLQNRANARFKELLLHEIRFELSKLKS